MSREALLPVMVLVAALAGPMGADMGQFFVRNPEPIVAPPNDEVSFECALRVPAEEIRWLHNGTFMKQGGGNHITKGSSLTFSVVNETQAGDYQCVAWFGASALTSLPGRLTIAELHAFLPRANETISTVVGNTVAIHCDAPYSVPPALLQYYRNGHKLTDDTLVLDSSGTLILENVSTKDAGQYHCDATNRLTGLVVTAAFTIMLKVEPPRERRAPYFLMPPPNNYTVRTGSDITLECTAAGNPTPVAKWEKYGNKTLPERATTVLGGLQLTSVGHSDVGTYLCSFYNGVGQTLVHAIHLQLQEPPLIVKMSEDIVVKEGGEVVLECQVKGSPDPQLTWVFNGESVVGDKHMTTNGHKLQITQVEKRHAGIFQCFASNPLGSVSGLCMLSVSPTQIQAQSGSDTSPNVQDPVDMPSTPTPWNKRKETTRKRNGKKKDKHKGNDVMIPPTRPNVTRLSDTSVMVRWDVPRNNGLSIQFFKVQYRELSKGRRNKAGSRIRGGPGEGSRWMTNNEDIPPHIRSYEVDDLRPEGTYRFRIAAAYVNDDNKLGPNSARFHLHRGNNNALTPPKLLQTEALSPSCIQIHWQYTSSARVPVEGFYVYYRAASTAGDYIQATVEGEDKRAFNITYLLPDTAYEMKLQSFTIDEASNFSAILSQKTLPSPTETPPVVEVVNPNVGKVEVSNNQTYVVLGAVLGGLVLLVGVFLGVFLCNRHRASNNQANRGSGDHQDKFNDPSLQMDSGNVFALNSKNLLNGRMQQNGFLLNSKMNITSNPLAESDEDKNQNVVEMSSQNNNRGQDRSEAGGSSTCDEPSGATSEVKSWRGIAPSASEKYV